MNSDPTGVEIVDHVLGGITPGLPCVVAGPSGAGRTVLSLQLAASSLAKGSIVSLLCNEPAPFLLQQAATLGLDVVRSPARGDVRRAVRPRSIVGFQFESSDFTTPRAIRIFGSPST